jgi:CheY-like chemotaxis protein
MARVLLVDDDADGIATRTLLLEHAGHQVTVASDQRSARARFGEAAPDCVIMDLRIPNPEDGLALIREFRQAAPGVKIVVLAGQITDLDGRAESQMVDEVLSKPVRSERLIRAISSSSERTSLSAIAPQSTAR